MSLLCLVPLRSFGGQQGRPNQTNYPGVDVQKEVPGSVKKLPGQSRGPTNYPGVYVQEVPSAAGQVPGIGHAQSAIVTDPRTVPPATDYGRADNQLYRVEIHDKGTGDGTNSPTARWSRDDGFAVLASPRIFTLDPPLAEPLSVMERKGANRSPHRSFNALQSWRSSPCQDRKAYLNALDSASIDLDIKPFCAFPVERTRW